MKVYLNCCKYETITGIEKLTIKVYPSGQMHQNPFMNVIPDCRKDKI